MALVLGILLYGSEVWSLREDLYHRLRRFHNRCARTMCRITIAHIIRHRITTNSLFAKLEIDPSTPTTTAASFGGPGTSHACPCPGYRANY